MSGQISALGINTRNLRSGSSEIAVQRRENTWAKQWQEKHVWVENKTLSKFRLQKSAKYLLGEEHGGDHAILGCMTDWVFDQDVQLCRNSETERVYYKGLVHCNSATVCPVCAESIALERRELVQLAMKAAQDLGLAPYFVTLTTWHKAGVPLADLMERYLRARRKMRSGRGWQNFKQKYFYVGEIKAFECTHGDNNGWHPHAHEVLFCSQWAEVEDLEEDLYLLWSKALESQGLKCSRERGVLVKPGYQSVAKYVTKWGLDSELTSINKSAKEGNYTPFQLLSWYRTWQDNKGNLEDYTPEELVWMESRGGLFQEYADAIKGVATLQFSLGLKALLFAGPGDVVKTWKKNRCSCSEDPVFEEDDRGRFFIVKEVGGLRGSYLLECLICGETMTMDFESYNSFVTSYEPGEEEPEEGEEEIIFTFTPEQWTRFYRSGDGSHLGQLKIVCQRSGQQGVLNYLAAVFDIYPEVPT
jgi:hypothetical protein